MRFPSLSHSVFDAPDDLARKVMADLARELPKAQSSLLAKLDEIKEALCNIETAIHVEGRMPIEEYV